MNMAGNEEECKKALTNAEKQKRYREKIKNNSTYKQKNTARAAKNYATKKAQNPDEVREKARLRKQRTRENARIENSKNKKISPQTLGKMVKFFSNLLPDSPSSKSKESKVNLQKELGKYMVLVS